MNKAVVVWQKIFDRRVNALKTNSEMPAAELRACLKSLIELIGLRWAMYTPPASSEDNRTLLDLMRVQADFVPSPRPRPIPAPREGGDDEVWWDRKTRYAHFDSHAKAIILRAADDHRLRERLDAKSSNTAFLKALAKMSGCKVSWKKMPDVGVEKGFAASVLFVIDPKGDLEKTDKQHGGLSNLLAKLEKALKLI